ncbi:hypothetical protein [Streptomyces atratus]
MLTPAVRDLEPGGAVLMTTYRSNGHVVATGELFLEVRTEAAEQDELLEELWDAGFGSPCGGGGLRAATAS